MKIKILHIEILLFLFITGCGSDSNSSTPSPTSGNCPNGQSLGCDDNCSLSPPEYDACGICDGDGPPCEEYWNILYDLSVPISGFQFNINNLIITGSIGGVAEEVGFTVATGNSTVLGFSLSGATISAGSGILVQITFQGNTNNACIDNLIISDSDGVALNAEIINCNKIKYSD